MELKIDLLRKAKKSKLVVGLGISFIILSILWLGKNIYTQENLDLFDYTYAFYFLLYGVVIILEGSGISIMRFFGKAFIEINEELIEIKMKIISKGKLIKWDDVEKIKFKTNAVLFNNKKGITQELRYSILGYKYTQQVKDVIMELGKSKQIPIN